MTSFLLSLAVCCAAPSEPTHVMVFDAKADGFPSIRIPAVIVTKAGTLLAFAEGRAFPRDHAKNKIVMKRSTDGGKTWGQSAHGMKFDDGPSSEVESPDGQDPHMMVQSPADPTKFWVQHHAGIFKSVNDGKLWTRVKAKPSSFGFGVVVHPSDPDTAWFVPGIKDEKRIPVDGALVVTRTRDGGKTFKSLKKGLPQKNAYDVVFRHALAIDETGDVLAMGSTTGNVWVSENQGDSWQLVSSTLPQVYAVRFG